jgi:two-component system phosphate regulon sensor histidine kinase PhoR
MMSERGGTAVWAEVPLQVGRLAHGPADELDKVYAFLGKRLGADALVAYRFDDADVHTFAAWPPSSELVEVARSALTAPENRNALRVMHERCLGEEAAPTVVVADIACALAYPIYEHDELVGVLAALREQPCQWSPDEIVAFKLSALVLGSAAGGWEWREAQEELERQKSGFIATTNHELRTPLTSIAGYLEILRDGGYGPLTPEQDRVLDIIERNVVRLGGLIENLLLLSRLEARRGIWTPERARPIDLVELLGEIVQYFRVYAGRRDQQVGFTAPKGLVVCGEREPLSRAFGNLVDNALKFTPKGGTVSVELVGDERSVTVRVTDTGRGVPADELLRISERFTRGATATRDHIPGVGNGLAVARAVIEGHGGSLDITSEEDVGTVCTVKLPLAPDGPCKV